MAGTGGSGSERTKTLAQTLVVGLLATALLAAALSRISAIAAIAGAVLALAGIAAVAVLALRKGRHTPWAEAKTQVREGHAVVFWKPTCGYCERLVKAVGDDDRITWVNVWDDAEANGVVRSYNDGNELTPTALVGDRVLINPSADELRAALA